MPEITDERTLEKREIMKNPINKERVVRPETQLLRWLSGEPQHNGQHRGLGECTPDFSCCHPDLLSTPNVRIEQTLIKLRDNLIEEMCSREPLEGEEVDLEQQGWFVATVERWFDDLIFDTCEIVGGGE